VGRQQAVEYFTVPVQDKMDTIVQQSAIASYHPV